MQPNYNLHLTAYPQGWQIMQGWEVENRGEETIFSNLYFLKKEKE